MEIITSAYIALIVRAMLRQKQNNTRFAIKPGI